MSSLPSFHSKAVAEKQAGKAAAIGECQRADEFLTVLDEILAEDLVGEDVIVTDVIDAQEHSIS